MKSATFVSIWWMVINLTIAMAYPSFEDPLENQQVKRISNQIYDPDLNQRDLATRWGSAGMPFSMFYLNHQAKYQQHMQKQQKLWQEKHPVRTTPASSRKTTTRKLYAVPQLFVSYGWGPMG